jgi:hypothetical protein
LRVNAKSRNREVLLAGSAHTDNLVGLFPGNMKLFSSSIRILMMKSMGFLGLLGKRKVVEWLHPQ